MPRCNCKICQEGRRMQAIIKKLPKADAKWLTGFYEYHINLGSDHELNEAILDGWWPSAVERLERALKRARKIRKEER